MQQIAHGRSSDRDLVLIRLQKACRIVLPDFALEVSAGEAKMKTVVIICDTRGSCHDIPGKTIESKNDS